MSHCCVVAFCHSLTGNPTSPTGHMSLRNPQHPRPVCCDIACFELGFGLWGEISQHTPGGGYLPMFAHTRRRFKSSVLRYLDFRPGLGTDLRDIAAQYSSDLIKGVGPQNARHSPLSSGASHVPALPPVPGTPRPLGSQEPAGAPGVPPCVLRYWGFRASFQPVLLENAAQYGMSRPTGRRRRRQAASPHPHACVCCDIVQIRPQTQPQTPISQHSAQHINQISPFHHPPTLQKCSTLLGAFSPIFGPMQTPTTRYRNTELRHSREPGDARPERVWSDAGPDATRLSGAGQGALGFRRRKAREIQGILIKITLTQTVIHTPQLPLMKLGKTQVSKK